MTTGIGRGVMEFDSLLPGLTSCSKEEVIYLGEVKEGCDLLYIRMVSGFCFTSVFCKISKNLIWCRNKAKTGINPGLKATVTLLI